MKNLALAITLIATAGSASAFWNDADSNTSAYGNGDFVGQTQGRGAATGKFTMTIKAKGSADMAGNGVVDGNNGSYAGAYGEDGHYYGSNTNGNFYNDGRFNTATSGAGSATGDFEMTVNAEGSANGNMSADANSNTGVYGQGYRQPYYGYAPYYSNVQ
jgi:hypothetical protein